MLKMYGTDLCPDCIEAKAHLDSLEIPYEYISITENMPNMKEFLLHRDTREEFKEFLGQGYVMIPALLTEEGKFIFIDDILEIKK